MGVGYHHSRTPRNSPFAVPPVVGTMQCRPENSIFSSRSSRYHSQHVAESKIWKVGPGSTSQMSSNTGRRRRSGLNWRWGTLGAKPHVPRPTLARESSWKIRASTPDRLREPVLLCGFRNCGCLVSHQNSVVLVAEPRWHVAQLIRASMPVRASCSLIVPSILIISRAISFLSISSDARSPST